MFSTGIHILCEETNSAKPQAVFPMKCLSSMVNIKRGTSYCGGKFSEILVPLSLGKKKKKTVAVGAQGSSPRAGGGVSP